MRNLTRTSCGLSLEGEAKDQTVIATIPAFALSLDGAHHCHPLSLEGEGQGEGGCERTLLRGR